MEINDISNTNTSEAAVTINDHINRRNSIVFIVILAGIVFLGIFLRLYLLADQVLLDDEWHGIYYVAFNHSVFSLLTRLIIPGATCIPQNVYNCLLLKTVGWSEFLLRLPSIVAGILSLLIFPALTAKIFSRRITLVFAWLLAISPLLVFYSRVARPYSIVVLTGFVSVLALYLWAVNGKKRYAVLCVATSVLAIYSHLFAIIPVAVPWGYLVSVRLWNRFQNRSGRNALLPTFKAMSVVAAATGLLLCILLLPGFINGHVFSMAGQDRITLHSLKEFWYMLHGTRYGILAIIFGVAFVFGLVVMSRKAPLLAGMTLVTGVGCFAALYITQPDSIQTAIVISRYVIVLFPLSFVAVAVGIDAIVGYLKMQWFGRYRWGGNILDGGVICILAMFLINGPLPEIYKSPNSFTNHAVFQRSYAPIEWSHSYNEYESDREYLYVEEKNIPPYYRQLAEESVSAVVEYPASYVDRFNLYYYYQHYHGKKVLMGYIPNIDLSRTIAIHWIDEALSIYKNNQQYKFRNMIDIRDVEALKQSSASYIILHKKLAQGEWEQRNYQLPYPVFTTMVEKLSELYPQVFGPPVFDDEFLVVFAIRRDNS